MLSACAVCAQEAVPAQQPATQKQPLHTAAKPTTRAAGATTATATSKTRLVKNQLTKKKTGKHKKAVVEEAPVAVTPAPPPPPPTPEQLPATAPQVTYREGLLSINSQNSTLGDILNAVRKLTGGTLDAPGTTLSERIATRLGPASPKDVLASLFSGSRFDYIILGSAVNPNGLERIILTPRAKGSPAQADGQARLAVNGAAQGRPAVPSPDAETDSEEDTTPDREQVVDEPATPQEQQQPEVPLQQNPIPNATDQQNPNATEQQNPQQPKSPEQLLKELQDMQRQRQPAPGDQPQNPR